MCEPVALVVTNQAPQNVSAGSDQVVAHTANPAGSQIYEAAFSLSGSANDPDYAGVAAQDQPLHFSWNNPAPSEITFLNNSETSRTPSLKVVKDCTTGCPSGTGRVGPYTFTLTVTDGNGASSIATTQVTIGNTKPTAPVITVTSPSGLSGTTVDVVSGTTVTLSAASTDADNDGLSYTWTRPLDPPPGATLTPNGATATVTTTAGTYGSYPVQVTASDGFETSNPAMITVRSNAPPDVSMPVTQAQSPLVHTCTDSGTCTASSSALTATATDAEGDAISYSWRVTSTPAGATVSFSDNSVQNPSVTIAHPGGAIEGTYQFRFCAGDSLHPVDPDNPPPGQPQCAWTLLDVKNDPPEILSASATASSVLHDADSNLTADTIYRARAFSLQANAKDPESSQDKNLTWVWTVTQKPDPAAEIRIAGVVADPSVMLAPTQMNNRTPPVTITKDCSAGCPGNPGLLGNYKFTLQVIDLSGKQSAPSEEIVVSVGNEGPVAESLNAGFDISDTGGHVYVGTGYEAQELDFPFRSPTTDPNADFLRYQWYVATSDAAPPCPPSASGVSVLDPNVGPQGLVTLQGGSSLVNNTHNVCLKAFDPWGWEACDCAKVWVGNQPPTGVSADVDRVVLHSRLGDNSYEARFTQANASKGTDDDFDDITPQWTLSDLSGVSSFQTNGVNGEIVIAGDASIVRNHTLCLAASDPFETTTDCATIEVRNDPPSKPNAGFANGLSIPHAYDSNPGILYYADVNVSPTGSTDPNTGDTISYRWYVGTPAATDPIANGPVSGAGTVRLTSSTGPPLIGTLSVCLEAKDSLGATNADCRTVTVTNQPPTITSHTASPNSFTFSCLASCTVTSGATSTDLSALISDPEGDPVITIDWNPQSSGNCTLGDPAASACTGTCSASSVTLDCNGQVLPEPTNLSWKLIATDGLPQGSRTNTVQVGVGCSHVNCL